jgi:mono/diheme cytochrome c family protein
VTLPRNKTLGSLMAVTLAVACARAAEPETEHDLDASARADGPPSDARTAHGDAHGERDTASPPDRMPASDAMAPADAASGDVAPSAAFAAVQAIFDRSCVRCHTTNAPPRPDSWIFAQLPLTRGDSHHALVGRPATQACGGLLVTAGRPDRSYIVHKLTEAAPCFGKRMPHPGMLAMAPPLAPEDIATITAWIAAGAPP